MATADEAGRSEAANPAGDAISAAELNRLRWRCRRGMLELDLLLNRFLDTRADRLTTAQWREFSALLDLEDQALWERLRDPRPASGIELQLRDCAD
ncbi:MAG: succinate dehydrogenase assembly factor 2 [Pseudomonadota bacterium]